MQLLAMIALYLDEEQRDTVMRHINTVCMRTYWQLHVSQSLFVKWNVSFKEFDWTFCYNLTHLVMIARKIYYHSI